MKIKINYIVFICFFFLLFSCKNTAPKTSTPMAKLTKTKDASSEDGHSIVTAPLSIKSFVKKNGEPTDKKEFYLQRSIQDYFIKFCESEITEEELQAIWDAKTGFMKTVTVEVEFRKGEWDNCEDSVVEVQSRTGEYVVIYRIL